MDDRDLNPDPCIPAPSRVLYRYYTRSRARAAALPPADGPLSPPGKRKSTSACHPSCEEPFGTAPPHKKVKLDPSLSPAGAQPGSDLLLHAVPPAVTYRRSRLGCDGTVELVPVDVSDSEGRDFVLWPFTLERLTFDAARALASRNKPRPPLPPFPPPAKKRNQRMCDLARTARRNLQRATEVVSPVAAGLASTAPAPAFETTNVTKSGNQGFIPRWRRDAVRAVFGTPQLVELLEKMQVVPYDFEDETDTAICDRNGRCISFRSKVVADIRPGESLIDKLTREVGLFIANCPISAKDREGNMRGQHFFCIMGVHRQYNQQPYETSFQRKYRRQIDWTMSPGSALSRYTLLLTNLIERRFPSLAERMLNNAKWHYKHSIIDGKPITPQFGLFWNCCINAPSPESGVERVVAAPHADSKNVAALFCALLAFWADGLVGEDEWSWLVLWDLGIILQCPRGSFVLYPSALLLHFNARIVKCKRGERPTPANSTEILAFVDGGRGSIVWFCQASMYSCTDEGMDGRTHEERVKDFIPVVLNPNVFDDEDI
ncbi:hypothetical protein AURDEDRAFT_177114 [Auricularia subglabra TFB-10046 SS5]|uniref:Uncharacterized protein n=1 Tax=Auricularia subglabra (strain TFB-10046 / SS5) TaxID=717982 RepID=J0D4Y4_AURST|nr:hypothetical protein AURDEDRAFT_177114 [Auricularia subglabra TFB-10046 SS5]